MKTRSIITQKFSQMDIDKQKTLKNTKLLLGLFALGVCLGAGYGCQRSYQQKKEAIASDRTIMATLINKRIAETDGDKTRVVFWLDTDDNQKTAEGSCSMLDPDAEKVLCISNLTNGTTKSLAEWREIASPYEVQHNPSNFGRSR